VALEKRGFVDQTSILRLIIEKSCPSPLVSSVVDYEQTFDSADYAEDLKLQKRIFLGS